jgi:hypothetical protein
MSTSTIVGARHERAPLAASSWPLGATGTRRRSSLTVLLAAISIGLATCLAGLALSASPAAALPCRTCNGGGDGGPGGSGGTNPPPTIQVGGTSPTFGWAGDTVKVEGAGFTGASRVSLGGASAQFQVQNDNTLTLTVPAAATSGPVTVTSLLGTASGGSYTISPALDTYNSQQIHAGCTSGTMNTSARLDRSTGIVVGSTTANNELWYCGYTGDVAAVSVDGSGKIIGYSNVVPASVGPAPLWGGGFASQTTNWTTLLNVGQASAARSLYIVQTLDSAATLQSALQEAYSVGSTIASLLSSL